jgi:hypothetical protein
MDQGADLSRTKNGSTSSGGLRCPIVLPDDRAIGHGASDVDVIGGDDAEPDSAFHVGVAL